MLLKFNKCQQKKIRHAACEKQNIYFHIYGFWRMKIKTNISMSLESPSSSQVSLMKITQVFKVFSSLSHSLRFVYVFINDFM